jgi:putative transposase
MAMARFAPGVDSRSVKSTGVGGYQRGYDGARKVKSRDRYLLVDAECFVLKALPYIAQK